jgi:hypothetical protein
MPLCNIYVSFPEIGRMDQNMQETISCGCVSKTCVFSWLLSEFKLVVHKKKCIVRFGVGVHYEILYSRREFKVTNTHTSGFKSISIQ